MSRKRGVTDKGEQQNEECDEKNLPISMSVATDLKAIKRCIPAFAVAFSGGFLVSVLDPFGTQLIIAFDLCGCSTNLSKILVDNSCYMCKTGETIVGVINLLLFVGAILGCQLTRIFSEYGRVVLLKFIAGFIIPGSLLSALAPTGLTGGWAQVAVGRFVAGIGMGCVCVGCPMYIGEMSPNSIRGKLQTISWVMQSSGSLFAVTLGLANWWRFVVFLPVVISLIALKMLSDVSETPYILLKRGSRDAAMAACEDIYVEEDVEKEFEAVVHSVEISRNKKKPLELMRENREYVHALLVGACLGFLQNLSGARSLLTSSSRIIVQAGFSARTANFLTFALLGVNVLATVAATFIMDSWGRRKVLIISFTGQALTAIIGAVPFYVSPNADNPVTTVVSLFAFLATYAFGVGPIPCMYLGEIFPLDFKGFGMSVGASANWTGISIATFIVLSSSNNIIFSMFAIVSVIAAIFTAVFVRETKGKSVMGSPYFTEAKEMGGG
ncbi:hypothetical protein TrCOL_g11951 [Triparma columacea]|uniref:Hexose transporter 1 n=1 Tax=Triparma columacea TaxID=722753 RepID=A0A9W7LEN9_9STRA|nr:hypothetical protein TrCOL_g11951 [Triparma columacea]